MGHIPKKLFVALRRPIDVVIKPEKTKVKVLPAFVVPANSTNFVRSANGWRRQHIYGSREQSEGTSFTINNDPISGLRVVGLSRRSGGGRAYKVICPPNHLVDLREDVLLDAIYNTGIDVGGKIKGEFVWSVNGSQMRLIRVGSLEHAELSTCEDLKGLKRISMKDLKVGSIYRGITGPPQLFLGPVSTIFIKATWTYTGGGLATTRTISSLESYKKKTMLWYTIYGNRTKTEEIVGSFDGYVNRAFDNSTDKYYGKPQILAGHSMRKEIGSIEIPDDIVYTIRDIKRNEVMLYIQANANHRYNSEDSILCLNSPIMNMVPYGMDPVDQMMREYERILDM